MEVDAAHRLRGLKSAIALLDGGQYVQAEQLCRQFRHDDVEAALLLGLAIGLRGDPEQAAPILNHVAAARPEHAHPCRDLARMMLGQGKASLIPAQYRACLRSTPDDLRLLYPLAEFLRETGGATAAVVLLDPVLRMRPADAEAHDQMGLALAEVGQFASAAAQFRTAIACDPRPAAFWANLGMMLKVERQFDAALEAYAEALARSPADRQIRVNRAVTRLHAGRFTEAWQDEDWILSEPGRSFLSPESLLPALSRLPDLTGHSVLVVQEEGLGDTLQFLRYLPLLAERGAKVVVAVPPALTAVMRTIPGVAEVPDGDAPIPPHDFHCSFNALPRAFETTLETIPRAVPYITADPALANQFARSFPNKARFRVGLVWAGQSRPWLPGFSGLDGRRSTELATLAPLATVPGVQFVSLQKGTAAGQVRTAANGLDLLDFMEQARDFADTAAIVANLDLVISVDTSVVHLAGAMGKPVFLLDRYDNCWRWLSGREDSPWYPSLRIFRQTRPGEWGPVIARVATELGEMSRADNHDRIKTVQDQVAAAPHTPYALRQQDRASQ